VLGCPDFLVDSGRLFMEIGFNQFEQVDGLLERDIWQDIEFLPDLQGIPRILSAAKRAVCRSD